TRLRPSEQALPTKQMKQWTTSPGKTHPLHPQSQTPNRSKPKRSENNAETVLPLLHHSARRDLHLGLAVRPEHGTPRPANRVRCSCTSRWSIAATRIPRKSA